MINLLPSDIKTNYRFARRNVALRFWVTLFILAFVGLGAIATYGLLTLHQQTRHYTSLIATSRETLNKQDFNGTQLQVKAISSDFKLVVQVLGNEVLFSKLISQITATIPSNANLTALSINKAQGAVDISAVATDYGAATQVQLNLADPNNKIFSRADIVNIGGNCPNKPTQLDANPATRTYPCTVSLHALFAANNPFLFISNTKVKTP